MNSTLQLPIWLHSGVTLSSHVTPHGNFLLPLLSSALCKQLPAPQPKSWPMQDRKDRNRRAEPNSPSFFPSSADILAALTAAVMVPQVILRPPRDRHACLSPRPSPAPHTWLCFPPPCFLAFCHSPPNAGCWSTPRSANYNPSYLIATTDLRVHAPLRASPSAPCSRSPCLPCLHAHARWLSDQACFASAPALLQGVPALLPPQPAGAESRKAAMVVHPPCSVKPTAAGTHSPAQPESWAGVLLPLGARPRFTPLHLCGGHSQPLVTGFSRRLVTALKVLLTEWKSKLSDKTNW